MAIVPTPTATAGPTATASAPSASPLAAAGVSARVHLDIPFPADVTDVVHVPADETIAMDITFSEAMDRDATLKLLQQRLPKGGMGWSGDRTLAVKARPGGSFVPDLNGAPAGSGATVVAKPIRFVRAVGEVALYDVRQIATGSASPLDRWRSLTDLSSAVFAPDGETVAIRMPREAHVVLLHLPSGLRHDVPIPHLDPFSRVHWMDDGRMVVTGPAVYLVSGSGEVRKVADVSSQFSALSPSGRRLALWTYGDDAVRVLDLIDASVRTLPGTYGRCGAITMVARLVWSPDEHDLAVDHCGARSDAMREESESTSIVDAATGAAERSIDGLGVVAWSSPDRIFAFRPSRASKSPSAQEDAQIVVIAPGRKQAGDLPGGISISRRWLPRGDGVVGSSAAQTTTPVLFDVASGQRYKVEVSGEVTGWTPDGRLVVVSRDESEGATIGPFAAAPALTVQLSVDTIGSTSDIALWMHVSRGETPTSFEVFGPDGQLVGSVPVMGSGIFTETSCVAKIGNKSAPAPVIGGLRAPQSVLRDLIAHPTAYYGRVSAGSGSGERRVTFVDSGCRGIWAQP